ncbi:MAG: alanine--glyoxylate aminotransferase family protein [Acidobacteria bacterium]|nr:alanine--glyoxylate aminotransferase family protein [Acidobacteriota bacterium]
MSSSFAPLAPPKRLLFGPGPSIVAPRVYEAMGQSIVGHLDPFFFQVNEEIRAGLQAAYGTANPFTMAISGTGSAGMEAAISNFVEPGMKLIVFANGFFCDRMTEMGRRQGATVLRFEAPWGQSFDDAAAAEFIRAEKPNAVAFVHGETSTGVFTSGKAICAAAHEVGALTIADCVTSLGTMPINIDTTGIDVAYSCSQKGLSCPPGLSPISCSPRAMDQLKARSTVNHSWYLDLKLLADYYDGARRYHHTAPISMFYALREGLNLILEEGVEARFARHEANHEKLVAGLESLGMEMLVEPGVRMWALHTPKVPAGVNDLDVRKKLMERHGIEIQGGFGPLAGQVFRIGLMGEGSTAANVDLLVGALREALV